MKQSRTRIKICGLRRQEDILAVNRARPDFCGFIVEFPKSFRSISAQEVRELTKGLTEGILPVGVFVNAPPELPVRLLEEGSIAMVQLHGQEDETYLQALRSYTEKPVIQAFSIRSEADIERALVSTADYILLDQGSGGTGKTFDWSLIPSVSRPFFLAGGLGLENLQTAIRQVHPWAVDLSSGLETEKKKDADKIQKAVELVHLQERGELR